jgi:predicted DsbA family dithiol-disulfide isomerase
MSVTFKVDMNPVVELSNGTETVSSFIRSVKSEMEETKKRKENAYELEKSSFTNSTTQSKISNQSCKSVFTFKPKMNAKSNLIAQKLLSFAERQDQHTQKQIKLVFILKHKKNLKELFYGLILYFKDE